MEGNNGQNDSFEFYLVSASTSIKLWVEEEISILKRRKCLPCFASIIQQCNSPLGNAEWVLRPLNESKSQCVSCLPFIKQKKNKKKKSETHPHTRSHTVPIPDIWTSRTVSKASVIVLYFSHDEFLRKPLLMCACVFVSGAAMCAHESVCVCVWAAGRLRRCYR